MVGGDQRVLEVGCWSGHVTEHLVAAGNRVVGVELDPSAAQAARRWAERVHVVDLDVTALSTLEHDRFDVILLGDVLEHFRDPSAVLADLVSLLEPDGRLVVSVPHVGHIDVRLHLLEGRWEYQHDGLLDRTHLRWFTRAGLRDLLAGAGFVAIDLDPVVQELGASLLPLTPGIHGADVIRFVRSDPDALVYQFVVQAVRTGREGGRSDVLAPVDVEWPDLDAESAARHEELVALRNEVDAWRRSRVVRYTRPIRSLTTRLRGRR
jgi:SAM-dependent methyltransferase